GVLALALTTGVATDNLAALWTVWWSGDAVGVLIVTPLCLAWTRPRVDPGPARYKTAEGLVAFVILAFITDLIFRSLGSFAWGIVPVTGWIAMRMGLRAGIAAVAGVAAVGTWYTVGGDGPFILFSMVGNLFTLQAYVAILAVKSMLFAAYQSEMLAAGDR